MVPRGLPASEASSLIRRFRQGQVGVLCYARAGNQIVRKLYATLVHGGEHAAGRG